MISVALSNSLGICRTPEGEICNGDENWELLSEKLNNVFQFLQVNHIHNARVQSQFYREIICPIQNGTRTEKIHSLLLKIWKTQAQPNLDKALPTWLALNQAPERFERIQNTEDLAFAIRGLVLEINNQIPLQLGCLNNIQDNDIQDRPLYILWCALKKVPGFGEKTAALFVKAVLDIHSLPECDNLRFIENFELQANDRIQLPVDSVIKFIFKKIICVSCEVDVNLNFSQINEIIFDLAQYNTNQASIWDELWFWGFITQIGGGRDRRLGLNEEKFMSISTINWEHRANILILANKFLQILTE